jgi:hypothetical protein
MNTFVITGPNTITLTVGLTAGGSVVTVAGVPYSTVTECLTDTFSVTGVPGGNPPVIWDRFYKTPFWPKTLRINNYSSSNLGQMSTQKQHI